MQHSRQSDHSLMRAMLICRLLYTQSSLAGHQQKPGNSYGMVNHCLTGVNVLVCRLAYTLSSPARL